MTDNPTDNDSNAAAPAFRAPGEIWTWAVWTDPRVRHWTAGGEPSFPRALAAVQRRLEGHDGGRARIAPASDLRATIWFTNTGGEIYTHGQATWF